MPDPFIIHRTGRVSDRETGEDIGYVESPEGLYWYSGRTTRDLYAESPLGTRRDAACLLWERWREQKGGRDG